MKPWLKGGLIGLAIGIILFPFIPLVSLSGLDLFIFLFNLEFTSLAFYVGIILFVLSGVLVGFFLNKKVPGKTKLIVFIIILIIFVPLSSYTHYVKYNDRKIMFENKLDRVSLLPKVSMKYPKAGIWDANHQEICEELSLFVSDLEVMECFKSVAKNKGDISFCNIFGETDNKWVCYMGVAQATKDTEICNLITKDNRKNECFLHVARVKKDISICEEIGPSYRKQDCYFVVARETKDTSICEKITNSGLKLECNSFGESQD